MKNWTAVRIKNWPMVILSLMISFTFITTWLPFLRCLFDGSSYRWGTGYFGMGFSSRGLSADYIFLVVICALYFALFITAYWTKKRWIYYALLIWWWLHSFGNLLYDIIKNGDTMFHGDTLNVHVSLSKIVIPFSVVAIALIVWVILKDRRQVDLQLPWAKANSLMAAIILGPIVLQAALFATGAPDNIGDKIGVLLALVQCFAIPFIFPPLKKKEE